MTYQVLARKWRPGTFEDMVGQEHVLRTLTNALNKQRLHHAYLFTGTRGVGKTTVARILAKCLNCETGVSATPCGVCGACRDITSGRFLDLIEVDAASRTKVEDTRELLENVQYAPSQGRFKIYLIDEVHMLSNHSFNALLKTLEEPPEHVKFLFATTDPHKLPVTILSRCLQFSLKNLAPQLIVSHLQKVLESEKIGWEEDALWQLATAAAGSMRDALTLLDQAIAHGDGRVGVAGVTSMLGTPSRQRVFELLTHLGSGDAKALISSFQSLAEEGPDYSAMLEAIVSALHRAGIAQWSREAVDNAYGDREQVLKLAQDLRPEDVQLYYHIAMKGQPDLSMASDPRGVFEMLLLRMLVFTASAPGAESVTPTAGSGASTREQEVTTVSTPEPAQKKNLSLERADSPTENHAPAAPQTPAISPASWADVLPRLGASGISASLLSHCVCLSANEDLVRLQLDIDSSALFNAEQAQRIEELLSRYIGRRQRVEIEVGVLERESPAQLENQRREARTVALQQEFEDEPVVQQLIRRFDGQLIADSIFPLDE